mmetsp:Transcript_9924/g.16335  ORF Transcript_9924/g.16335 Transcript_9924/m.16335 type:complete len:242 (-) Transcript_9924:703-1428(-)
MMMSKKVLLVRHDHSSARDRVDQYITERGYEADTRRPFAGDKLPECLDGYAGVLVFGGPFEAYATDKYPFLKDEYAIINLAIKSDVPLLGICQGCQMIAHHFGAWVGADESNDHFEFGYFPIHPTADAGEFLKEPLVVAQVHYHTYDLPLEAVHLASSSAYKNQAFRIGDKIFGFQFHAEMKPDGFRFWQELSKQRYGANGAQSKEEQDALMVLHDAGQGDWFMQFIDRLFATGTGTGKQT